MSRKYKFNEKTSYKIAENQFSLIQKKFTLKYIKNGLNRKFKMKIFTLIRQTKTLEI